MQKSRARTLSLKEPENARPPKKRDAFFLSPLLPHGAALIGGNERVPVVSRGFFSRALLPNELPMFFEQAQDFR